MARIRKHGVVAPLATGTPIFGSAGLVAAFSKRHRISAACLMGETGLLDVDANSAKAVLQVINKLLGVGVDLENMDRLKTETEKMLKELEESSKAFTGSTNYIR